MYQRKEKNERQGSQEGVLELFSLLESPDPETRESVKNVIYENLSATKDSKFLSGLVNYCIAVQSERSLDILLRVKDPHDKHLFDKINELMKNECSRYQSLQLLSRIVYKQPSWLHKIAHYKVMHTLFHVLKNDINPPNLISALFIIICLLPMIPSQFGPFLQETFEVFSRLISWNIKKPTIISETCVLHLQIGVYSLFHRLYGMFPCNFLAYLRSYYGGRDGSAENFKIFSSYIKPMLERVRLHPLLVTASKETELAAIRWKKMAYHDIIVECAAISLDAVEGTPESLNNKNTQNDVLQQSGTFSQDNMQYVSFSSQSSTMSANLESTSAATDPIIGNQDSMWSPSHACGFSTPPPASTLLSPLPSKNEWEFKTQLSIDENVPLDYAVEAKPEVLKSDRTKQLTQDDKHLHKTNSKDSKNSARDPGQSFEESDKMEGHMQIKKDRPNSQVLAAEIDKNIFQAVEAKEEDVDKEVSELTCIQDEPRNMPPTDVRHDTPFCSTTQNLTDEPTNAHKVSISSSGHSDSLTKSNEDDADDIYISMQETEVETFVPAYGRYRYLSHCGLPPDISQGEILKPKAVRSLSCPANIFRTSLTVPEEHLSHNEGMNISSCTSSDLTSSSAFIPNGNFNKRTSYEHLIPMALPSHSQTGSGVNSNSQYGALFTSLSPPELLDHYIRMGNATYLKQLNSIPIPSMKNTDWTHFDGTPPPDEIAILRNEVLLLQNQLLFERHRKDVHSERNRRILGRAKKSRIQEELIEALKGHIGLLEKHKQDFVKENELLKEQHRMVQNGKQLMEEELTNHISKICHEKSQLLFSYKKLQCVLATQKQENQDIQEMILLQELIGYYENKIELLKELPHTNIGKSLLKDAEYAEIKELKQKLETKSALLDASKAKIADLEMSLSSIKFKQKEQNRAIEHLKLLHKDQIEVREERLKSLTRVTIQKDAYILELHKDIETLSEKLNTLERKHVSNSCASTTRTEVHSNNQDSCRGESF